MEHGLAPSFHVALGTELLQRVPVELAVVAQVDPLHPVGALDDLPGVRREAVLYPPGSLGPAVLQRRQKIFGHGCPHQRLTHG